MLAKLISVVLAAAMLACGMGATGVYAEDMQRENIALFNYSYTGASTSGGAALECDNDKGCPATGGMAVRSSSLFASIDGTNYANLTWSDTNLYYYGGKEVEVPCMAASKSNKWGEKPYFLIETSTAEYKDIQFSARVGGSNKGPKNYTLQYSTDGKTYIEIINKSVNSNKDLDSNQIFKNVSVPAASDSAKVYFKIIAASTDTIDGKKFNGETGGEAAINDIVITGIPKKTTIAEFKYAGNTITAGKELTNGNASDGYTATGGTAQLGTKLFASLDGTNKTKLLGSSANNNTYVYDGSTDSVVPIIEAGTVTWGTAPYFLIKTSTKGYKNISFSACVGGTNAGPRDYKLQYSVDGTRYSDIASASVTVNKNLDVNRLFANVSVPVEASDEDTVWFKIVAATTVTLGGTASFNGESSGEAAINDIIIRGDAKPMFPGADCIKKRYDKQNDDPADAYTAVIDYATYNAPQVKWVVTNNKNESKDLVYGTVISGKSTASFGLIITGTEEQLDTISSVRLDTN